MKTQTKLTLESKAKLQKIFLILLVICTFGLLIVRLITANSFVDDSQIVGKLESESQRLTHDNEILTGYVQKNSSLVYVKTKASDLGFVPTATYGYLPAPSTMALVPLLKFQ